MYITPLYQRTAPHKNVKMKNSSEYYYKEASNFGFYLEFNMNLKDILLLHFSYLLPMSLFSDAKDPSGRYTDGKFKVGDGDLFRLKIETDPKLIPTGISFGFEYIKEYFIPSLMKKGSLLDGYSQLLIKINFPILTNLRLSISGGITSFYNEMGKFEYVKKGSAYRPEIAPLFAVVIESGIFDKYMFNWD